LDEALRTGDGLALARYPERLEEVYGLYFRVARMFVRAIGNPAVMSELTRIGMHSKTLMEWVLRIMSNLLRPDELGPAEAVYRTLGKLVGLGPELWERRRRRRSGRVARRFAAGRAARDRVMG